MTVKFVKDQRYLEIIRRYLCNKVEWTYSEAKERT